MAGLKQSRIRKLWKKVQRFDSGLWTAVVTPCRGKRKSFVDCHAEIAEFMAGVVLERRDHVSDAAVWAVTQAKFGLEDRLRESCKRSCRRFRKKHRAKIIIATHPDRARSLFMPAYGRSVEHVSDFLEVVQLDGSPLDSLTTSTASGRRQALIMVDSVTRLGAWVIAPSESTLAAGRLMIKFFRLFGLPHTIRTDHGSGFISEAMRIFLARAGVECLDLANKYAPQGKAIAEAFVHEIQRFTELTNGFAGHSVADRQALRGYVSMANRRGKPDSKVLGAAHSDDEMEALGDQYLLNVYANRPHAGLGGGRLTPFQKLAECQGRGGGKARRPEDEAALYGILAERGIRRVQKKCIKVEGFYYTAPALAAYPDEEVEYRRLPDYAKLAIFTTGESPEFIAIVINDELLGQSERQTRALEAGKLYREFTSNVRKAARRLVKNVGGNPAEILLSAASQNGRVEVATIPFSTPALEASAHANEAAAAIDVPSESRSSNVITLPVERREDDLPARRQANYERLLRTPAAELSEEQRAWMRVFEHFDGAGMPLGRAS